MNEITGLSGLLSYRLPSEAESEYACRAGTDTVRWWGDSWDPEKANGADGFEKGKTSPVYHYQPNPWKLHDMIGNVWEWCADMWTDNISKLPDGGTPFERTNVKVGKEARGGASRILRGGSWYDRPNRLRSAFRCRLVQGIRIDSIGFRLCRTL